MVLRTLIVSVPGVYPRTHGETCRKYPVQVGKSRGSIPVHTGKPALRGRWIRLEWGLSPYTRGNLTFFALVYPRTCYRYTAFGSIPVHTGKPTWVDDPRTRGNPLTAGHKGLSPYTRGNLDHVLPTG